MDIDDQISELISEHYKGELRALFVAEPTQIDWDAETGGRCTAIIIRDVLKLGFDIVITQNCRAPYAATYANPVAVALYKDFSDADFCQTGEATYREFDEHADAIAYVAKLKNMLFQWTRAK